MIKADPIIVAATAERLRDCGVGRRECVTYWLAPVQSDQVLAVRHPRHAATATGYEVDGAWLTDLFLELSTSRLRIAAQLHSHPGNWVGHSGIDDAFAVVEMPGLISIVVPRFAVDGISPSACGIFVLTAGGGWLADRGAVRWT